MSKIPADMDRLDKIQKRADIKKNKYNEYRNSVNIKYIPISRCVKKATKEIKTIIIWLNIFKIFLL